MTLPDYRQRYGQYHTDADLLEARRLVPFVTTPDDHEVENNYAGVISEKDTEPDQDPTVFAQRRAAAYQAYWEWMPMRRAQRARNGSIQLFRELPFGDLADVVVADTRQFRTDQPCDDRFNSVCPGMDDPAQTLPGLPQERWLIDRMGRSRSRWKILAQQVQMAQEDFKEGPDQGYNTDSWDGYKQSRNRVLGGLQRAHVRNAVVLTGDVHQHYAADLNGRLRRSAVADRGQRARVDLDHLGRRRQRRRPGRGPAREPVDQVQRQPPRLRSLHAVALAVSGRLPQAGLRQPARRAGADGGVVRARGRHAGAAARVSDG
jgi:alkaline phosphatase D